MILLKSIKEKNEREEAERKKRIQLYVFILRSVAYPFNAKQPSDMSKRHLKVTKDGHDKMKAKIEVSLIRPKMQNMNELFHFSCNIDSSLICLYYIIELFAR